MGLQFDVHVLNSEENPVSGARVTAYLHEDDVIADILKGGTLEEYTDDEGHAAFQCGYDTHNYVVLDCRGQRFGPYRITDGDGFTINVT